MTLRVNVNCINRSTSNPKYYQAYETKGRKKQTKNKTIKTFARHELIHKQLFLSLYTPSQLPHKISMLKFCNKYDLVFEFL